jgi:phenylacetic acid degradation operon negative regulatory protein
MSKDRNTAVLERPLSARSLIASLLLRSQPPRMRGARLVQWCGLFGVAEGTARVALSRMVERGELRTAGGTYELAGRVGARRPVQDWSLAPRAMRWNGQWRIATVHDRSRAAAERSALRDAMRSLRLGELREGVWVRPHNLPRAAAPEDAWNIADAQCEWWTGAPDADPEFVVGTLFDPAGWARRAQGLETRLTRVTSALDGTGDARIANAFESGVAALAHIRSDPLLPVELGPSAHAGDALRAAYAIYEREFSAALRAWFRERT